MPALKPVDSKGGRKQSYMSDIDNAKLVASMFVGGMTAKQMAYELDVSEWTIGQWRRDPRVKAHAHKLIEDRIIQISRRVDSQIERRLENADKLSIRELLEIRKEFLGGALRRQTEDIDEGTVNEAVAAIEKNPDLVEQLAAVLAQAQVTKPDVPADA